tara:strand:+ start:94 stop:432 length:339 start_codon:yes stop_codon:yes gene_type:complete
MKTLSALAIIFMIIATVYAASEQLYFEAYSSKTYAPCRTNNDCVYSNACCGYAYKFGHAGFHVMCAPRGDYVARNWNPEWMGFSFRCFDEDGSMKLFGISFATVAACLYLSF